MVKISFSGDFYRNYHRLVDEDFELRHAILQRIKWFEKNPKDTRLDNHLLTKKMEGKCAFSITNDIRIVYKWTSKTTVRFLAIGPHSKVYN